MSAYSATDVSVADAVATIKAAVAEHAANMPTEFEAAVTYELGRERKALRQTRAHGDTFESAYDQIGQAREQS